MDRAYGTLELRAVDDELRIFEGFANSDSEDSHGTVLDPAGAQFRLPIPLHYHHDQKNPVGSIIASEVRGGKRWVRGQIPKITDDGTEGGREVKRRVDSAWADVKNDLMRGLSVEFLPIEPKSPHAKRWTKWRWLGLGLVSVPSNQDATITLVRSIASPGAPLGPGDPGSQPSSPRRPMTILEQIQQHENSRAAKVAQMEAIRQRTAEENRAKDAAEQEDFETLRSEVEAHDRELTDLRGMEKMNRAAAVPVLAPSATPKPGVPIVRVRANVEPGIGMARAAMVLLRNYGSRADAIEDARRTYPDQAAEIELQLRAAVAAGTTTDATWAGPLAAASPLANEFLALLRPQTLLGKIPGLRNVPFNVTVPSQTTGGTYSWVGEGVAKPITAAAFATVALRWAKAAGIIVLTDELVRHSTPSAEGIIRGEMIAGIAQFLDGQFVDPAVAAVANVSPASITNTIVGLTPSGTTEAAARTDMRTLLKTYQTNNIGLDGVVLLMTESMAFTLGTLINAVGAPTFPGLGVNGGSLMGIPVVTSNTVGARIIAVHAPSILFADEGGVTLDMSREATLQMDGAPDNPTTATTVMVSMFQRNLVALRAERYITWIRARTLAVQWIDTPAYV